MHRFVLYSDFGPPIEKVNFSNSMTCWVKQSEESCFAPPCVVQQFGLATFTSVAEPDITTRHLKIGINFWSELTQDAALQNQVITFEK